MIEPPALKSLKQIENIERKRSMLDRPHIVGLTRFVEQLRKKNPTSFYPYFDPDDGGIKATSLFLLEKPGPKTFPENGGSGFISRDNNDESAANLSRFMFLSGIDRKKTILWNVIPGWNGTIKITKEERNNYEDLSNLLLLLKDLKHLVLVEREAQRAEAFLKIYYDQRCPMIIKSPHPSPKNRKNWAKIVPEWIKCI